MNGREQLHQELRAAGASPYELERLLSIAGKLPLLKTIPGRKTSRFGFTKPVLYVAPSLVAAMGLVIFSQSVLPSSWLYPVQKISDAAIIEVHPEYRATVMMKRAYQVNQLVASRAEQEQIVATLADYTKQASAYKDMSRINYSAFEYCENNLKHAMTIATPSVRQAIANSLHSVETT